MKIQFRVVMHRVSGPGSKLRWKTKRYEKTNRTITIDSHENYATVPMLRRRLEREGWVVTLIRHACPCRAPRTHRDCSFCGSGSGMVCGECSSEGVDGPIIKGTDAHFCRRHARPKNKHHHMTRETELTGAQVKIIREVANDEWLTIGERRALFAFYRSTQVCNIFDKLDEVLQEAIREVQDRFGAWERKNMKQITLKGVR